MPREDAPLLLGIDVGTTSTKAVLVERDGRVVGRSSAATPFVASGGGIEADVDALVGAVARVVRGLGSRVSLVAGTGIAGVAESGAPFGRSGEPLGPVIAWHDERGDETVTSLLDRFGDGISLRIGQRLRTVSSVAKLGWLGARGVRACRWLGVPELCLRWMTGAEATEFSLAARTGCYDVGARAWMPEVADALDIPVGVFPPVLPAGAPMGQVSPEGERASGVPAGTPVTIAGHDHLAGAEAVGGGENDAINSVGTAEVVLRRSATLPDVALALPLRLAVTVRPGGEGWAVLASAVRAGLVLECAASALGRSLARLDALAEGSAAGGDEAAAACRGASRGQPSGTLEVDLDAIVAAGRAGRPPALPAGDAGEVWDAVLSALAARTADALARQHRFLPRARRLVVFGGGSVSRPWLRAKERAVAMPVVATAVPDAVARAAAVFGGVAAGWWPSPGEAPPPALTGVV